MKKLLLIVSMVFFALLLNAQNLVSNGDFETWTNHSDMPDGWAGTTAIYNYASVTQHNNTMGNVLNLVNVNPTSTKGLYTTTANIQSPGTYRVSFWVKSNGTNKVALQKVSLLGANTGYATAIASDQTYVTMSSWTQVLADVVVTLPGCYKFQLNWSSNYSYKPSDFYIDDINVQLLTPTLTSAGGVTVDAPFDVTFTDDPIWRAAITGITIDGTVLDASAYNKTTAGKITFTPSASVLLQTPGSKVIAVTASGYPQVTLTQSIGYGAAAKLAVKTQPTSSIVIETTALFSVQPAIYIQDQFGNTVTNSTASITASINSGSWTLSGTTTVNAAAGVASFSNLSAYGPTAISTSLNFTSSGLTHVNSTLFSFYTNFAQNGSMETWTNHSAMPDNWTGTGTFGTQYFYVSDVQHDGGTGNILNLVEPTTAASRGLATPTNIDIQSAGSYHVSFWVKSKGTNKVALISNRLTNGTSNYITNIASNQTYTVMTNWTQVVNDIVIPPGFTAGNYKFQINWSSSTAANLSNFYIDDIIVQPVAPILTAAADATVDAQFDVTFTDDATWRAAINGITVDGKALVSSAYSISAGKITFKPQLSALLQTVGTKTIVVKATDYMLTTFSQQIAVGNPAKLVVNVQPKADIYSGARLTTQPIVYIQDQYGNATTSIANVVATVGSGSWSIGGTATVAAVNGISTFTNLTATATKDLTSVPAATISFSSAGLTAVSSAAFNVVAPPVGSTPLSRVTIDGNGILSYIADEKGNQIPDFSGVGYKNGEVVIPAVPVVKTITAVAGDNLANVQNAINAVAAMPIVNGFRGALLLKAGTYSISNSLTISATGVVLRGEGDATNLMSTKTSQINFIQFKGSSGKTDINSTVKAITDVFVPIGSKSVTVQSGHTFAVGDLVHVRREPNQAWIAMLGMDTLSRIKSSAVDWTTAEYIINYERKITNVQGNILTFDAPMVDVIDATYAKGYVTKFTSARIQNCGIENMKLSSSYASDSDVNHGWNAIVYTNVEHCWAKKINGYYFGMSCVSISSSSAFITVDGCSMSDAKSLVASSSRYTFNIGGQRCVVENCTTHDGILDYVTQNQTAGPNVFYNCTSVPVNVAGRGVIGPHQRWATGILFDNVSTDQRIEVSDASDGGTGHGWCGAQIMLWNCNAGMKIAIQDIPSYHCNWAIGCVGELTNVTSVAHPFGIVESQKAPITTIPSLYVSQLHSRGINLPQSVIDKPVLSLAETSDIPLQLSPNPASNKISLKYNVAESSNLQFDIYNLDGKKVKAVFTNSNQSTGVYNETVDISELNAGVYVARLVIGNSVLKTKLIVVK